MFAKQSLLRSTHHLTASTSLVSTDWFGWKVYRAAERWRHCPRGSISCPYRHVCRLAESNSTDQRACTFPVSNPLSLSVYLGRGTNPHRDEGLEGHHFWAWEAISFRSFECYSSPGLISFSLAARPIGDCPFRRFDPKWVRARKRSVSCDMRRSEWYQILISQVNLWPHRSGLWAKVRVSVLTNRYDKDGRRGKIQSSSWISWIIKAACRLTFPLVKDELNAYHQVRDSSRIGSFRSSYIIFYFRAYKDHNGVFPDPLSYFDRELLMKNMVYPKKTSEMLTVTSHKIRD